MPRHYEEFRILKKDSNIYSWCFDIDLPANIANNGTLKLPEVPVFFPETKSTPKN
jgi:hypothetical protein